MTLTCPGFMCLLLMCLALGRAVPAAACSCASLPLCMALGPGSQATVFEATVASIEMGELPLAAGRDMPPDLRRVKYVHLKDIRNLLGEGEPVVMTTGVGTSCEIPFTEGRRYVIEASRGMGILTTGGCSRTRAIEQAGDLLAHFERLGRPSPGATVTGTVRAGSDIGLWWGYDKLKPRGVTARLEGPVTRTVAVREEDGRFDFDRLPPGAYALEVVTDGPWVTERPAAHAFTLRTAHDCYHTTVDLTLDSTLSGSVVDPEGRPVEGATVDLRRATAVDEAQRSTEMTFVYYEHAETDELGRYVFEGVPPGEFVAGLNLSAGPTAANPYASAFVAGADGQPEVITLSLGAHHLLPPVVAASARFVEVRGRVLWPDGRPGEGMSVRAFAYGEATVRAGVGMGVDTTTDADGRFVIELPAGLAHTMRAFVDPSRGRSPDDYRIEAVTEMVAGAGDVTLVLRRRP